MEQMNIYKKLNKLRAKWNELNVKPSGENKFTSAKYFELGDLTKDGIPLSDEIGLTPIVNLLPKDDENQAEMIIYDTDSDKSIRIAIDRADAGLKGVTEVQQLGAEITYLHRYLWLLYLNAAEKSEVDANNGTGKLQTKKEFTQLDEIKFLIEGTRFDLETIYDWIEKKFKKRIEVNNLTKAQFAEMKNGLQSAIKKDKENIQEANADNTPYNYMK